MAVIEICIFHLKFSIAEDNVSNLEFTVASISKPPYTKLLTNDSFDNAIDVQEINIRDKLLRHIEHCLNKTINIKTHRAASQFQMIELLKQNIVQMAFPIFEPPTNRQYNGSTFLKLGNYPGSEFITTEDKANALNVVMDEVMESWPLLAVTLVLTAIAGIAMWALVSISYI